MMASSQLVYQQPMARVHHEILTTGLNLELVHVRRTVSDLVPK